MGKERERAELACAEAPLCGNHTDPAQLEQRRGGVRDGKGGEGPVHG